MTPSTSHAFPLDCEEAVAYLEALRDKLREQVAKLKRDDNDRERDGRPPAIPTGATGSGWDWRLYNILTGWTSSTPGSTFGPDEEEDNL